jgi:hypothetical protein
LALAPASAGASVSHPEGVSNQLWQEDGDQINLGVGGDLGLRIRIDGKEGWIHSQEDFNAVGLPLSG